MTNELIETMKAEGWTFGYQCRAYDGCTMGLHFRDKHNQPHAVHDEDALARYFGTLDQRQEAMARMTMTSRSVER